MDCYEYLANAIIEKAVDDYRITARKLHYIKNNKDKVKQKIVEKDERRINPIHYTSIELEAEYNRKVRAIKCELLHIESFFSSWWYSVLTKVDGKRLISAVKEQMKQKECIDCDFL